MHSRLRAPLAAVTLAALAIIGTTSAALAAETTKFTVHDAWTFDDVALRYEFDMEHSVKFIDYADGDGRVVIKSTEHTDVYEGDQLVAVIDEVSKDKTAFVDGGQMNVTQKVKSIAVADGEECVYTATLRIVDFEVVVDRSDLDCDPV
jgi:hypothetical protein